MVAGFLKLLAAYVLFLVTWGLIEQSSYLFALPPAVWSLWALVAGLRDILLAFSSGALRIIRLRT